MGFSPDLDLSDFIADYEPFFDGRGHRTIKGNIVDGDDNDDYFNSAILSLSSTSEPIITGGGPTFCSTSVELATQPQIIWDVNNYYKNLGVSTRASRKELRQAFQQADGHSSDYLTYIMTQLLNPRIRYEYDLMPLGSLYINDRFVQGRIKDAARKESDRRKAQGEEVTPEEVIEEMGLKLEPPIEEEENLFEDQDEPGVPEEEPELFEPWEYSYYLWKSICPEEERLKEWQTFLHRASVDLGVAMRFSVGYCGGSIEEEWHLRQIDEMPVFFLNEGVRPDIEKARQAIALVGQ